MKNAKSNGKSSPAKAVKPVAKKTAQATGKKK